MEIEFTPVENRKKTRSPSPTKATTTLTTFNHYEALSDEDEDLKAKGIETALNLKKAKARTKSKSPSRRHKSKSPKPRKEKKKKSKNNELEEFLLAEAIQQNSDLLKVKKTKKKEKSIASFFGTHENPRKENKDNLEEPSHAKPSEPHSNLPTTMVPPDAHTDPNTSAHATQVTLRINQDEPTQTAQQGDPDSEHEQWEKDSQDDSAQDDPQSDPELEDAQDQLSATNRELTAEEGERYPHIERGTQPVLASRFLRKYNKKAPRRPSEAFQSPMSSQPSALTILSSKKSPQKQSLATRGTYHT